MTAFFFFFFIKYKLDWTQAVCEWHWIVPYNFFFFMWIGNPRWLPMQDLHFNQRINCNPIGK